MPTPSLPSDLQDFCLAATQARPLALDRAELNAWITQCPVVRTSTAQGESAADATHAALLSLDSPSHPGFAALHLQGSPQALTHAQLKAATHALARHLPPGTCLYLTVQHAQLATCEARILLAAHSAP